MIVLVLMVKLIITLMMMMLMIMLVVIMAKLCYNDIDIDDDGGENCLSLIKPGGCFVFEENWKSEILDKIMMIG